MSLKFFEYHIVNMNQLFNPDYDETKMLNSMGNLSWELVAIHDDRRTNVRLMYFKREKQVIPND